ncbi:MAG: helix-turn-helix transcriptional regulator [Candidatus Latescibacteria bacterium]|nr:helix-turn-helix transcriptional regulator [Candidatus Latescibacterota bacterium]
MKPNVELKVRLLRASLTQVELSRRLGISNSLLAQYINGYLKTPWHIRQKIEEILGGEEQSEQQQN